MTTNEFKELIEPLNLSVRSFNALVRGHWAAVDRVHERENGNAFVPEAPSWVTPDLHAKFEKVSDYIALKSFIHEYWHSIPLFGAKCRAEVERTLTIEIEKLKQMQAWAEAADKADGCEGCKYMAKDEFEMPCLNCKRNKMDYWRAP